MKKFGRDLQGVTVALQGFGNVGTFTAGILHEKGAKVVAVSDVSGGVLNPDGLDIPRLQEHVRVNKGVKNFPGTDAIDNAALLAADVEVLIPAALGGVLTGENADAVRAKYVVEAANNPTEASADDVFRRKGIVVVPDILANAGGVTVSYFEWVQNRQHFRWDVNRVRDELGKVMLDGFDRVWTLAEEKKVSLRTAAYILGIGRVGRATVLGGI
jgi:glutamate dehydrogenase (NAD(P)+)